jgi:GNAT superfamily N-acetyltransferase
VSGISKRQYRSLLDFSKIYDFMLENYTRDCRNGCSPTFFEYAQVMHWSEKTQNHRFAIWEDDGRVVAFCWYENSIGEAYFNIKEGYENLIDDMISHAEDRLSKSDETLELVLFGNQKAIIEFVEDSGYNKVKEWAEGIYDFSKGPLEYQLPEGFSFEEEGKYDMKKMIDASWRGFDNVGEPDGGVERGYHLWASPNATPELDIVVKNENNDYVCYAGMWWIPKIHLAYLEPLCTVPEYRRKGLAAAALSELYRRTKKLGATHMTGGSNEFYFAIGYEPIIKKSIWKKSN